MKIKDAKFYGTVRDYLTIYLPSQKECSPNTVKSYREGLNLFLSFIADSKDIRIYQIGFDDISPENLGDFISWLQDERCCGNTTINQRIAIIRAFLKYTGARFPDLNSYYVKMQQVPFKKVEKDLTVNFFSEKALEAILKQPDPKKKSEHRNLFYLILLYDTGARNQEILDLHPTDFVTTGKSSHVVIHGKGNKTRCVPIMEKTMEHFESYIRRFSIDPKDTETTVFFTTSHGYRHPMSDDNVTRFLKGYAASARKECDEVPDKVTPHMFRHSRAIHLYRKGVPLVLISEWLGHSNLETTLIYAYADTEMKRKAIEAATEQNHPLRKRSIDAEEPSDAEFKKAYGLL
jgi:site-specific recombinase XerD